MSGEGVIDGGELGVELGGDVGFGDGGVVVGEVVALVAEGADPEEGGEVDAGVGVEDGGAGLAAERGVREVGNVGVVADRGDRGGQGDDALGGLHLGARPGVPGHADAVDAFRIGLGHLRHGGVCTRSVEVFRERERRVGGRG